MIRCFRQVSCRGNGSIWQKLLWELLSVGWCRPFSIIERGMIWGLIFIRSLFGVLLFWLLLRLFMAWGSFMVLLLPIILCIPWPDLFLIPDRIPVIWLWYFLFVWINGYDYGKGRIRIGWNGRDIMGPWQYCFLYSVCFLREWVVRPGWLLLFQVFGYMECINPGRYAWKECGCAKRQRCWPSPLCYV